MMWAGWIVAGVLLATLIASLPLYLRCYRIIYADPCPDCARFHEAASCRRCGRLVAPIEIRR